MSVLNNARHERFAQGLAKGMTADEAYQAAGYSKNDGNASRLKGNERVAARVAELQERGAIRTEVTIETLTRMFIEDRQLARELKQTAAAVSAADKLARLHGYMVERSINENYDYLVSDEPVSADEPDAWLESSRPH